MGKKTIACKEAVKWGDEEVKEAKRVRRETHGRCISSRSTVGWEELTQAREEGKMIVKKRKKKYERCSEEKQMEISMAG